jgi:hypothetical protein
MFEAEWHALSEQGAHLARSKVKDSLPVDILGVSDHELMYRARNPPDLPT